jgi:hypothetical protein
MGQAHKGLVKGMFIWVKLSAEMAATTLCLMTFSLPTFGTSVKSSILYKGYLHYGENRSKQGFLIWRILMCFKFH